MLALVSLFAHVALVWFIPPPDSTPRRRAPDLAAVELVEWQPSPHELSSRPSEPEMVTTTPAREPEVAPTDPVPEPKTDAPVPEKPDRPSVAPDEPPSHKGSDTPAPAEPPPIATAPDSSSGAVAPMLSTRGNGIGPSHSGLADGPITSPRLSGSDARGLGNGSRHGVEPPPVASDPTDAEPKTLAEAGFLRNRKGDIVYADPLGHFKATLLPDGRVRFRDYAVARGSIRSGGKMMGLSEIVREAQGKDLWFLDKRRLLARTEKLRLALAIKWAEAQVETRLRALYRDLLEIWTDAERTVVQRRERLFQRWDECVEAMSVRLEGFGDAPKSTLDELRERAGGEARASIEAFIRKHLPKDSEDAYPPDELRELNRRRHSEEPFDPYSRG